jgi:ATP adenylyltransferase
MKRIWATWRIKYILSNRAKNCVFCEALQADNDAAHYIIYRSSKSALMLNLYPYINGHMMVVPYLHTGDLLELDQETTTDMMGLTQLGVRLLRGAMQPHGFNVGLNLGQAAGAGIQDHVHIHIVPRWENDTNFMPVLGDVRVIPESLDETYRKLLAELGRVKQGA